MFKKIYKTIRASWVKEVCPFCFETFRLKQTPFRCASQFDRCAPEPDPVLSKVWGEKTPIATVLPTNNKFITFLVCNDCGERSYKRICPACHQELPHTFGNYRNYIFAVIGASGAGKSHYIPALIEQIKNQVGPRMQMLLQEVNDYTINRYRKHFYDPLYKRHKVIEGTQQEDINSRMPMTYTLTFTGNDFLNKSSIKKAVTISFFDTAGENFKSDDTLSIVNKYIYRSNGILLLIDPLQIDKVRDHLAFGISMPKNVETTDIVSRIVKLIQLGCDLDSVKINKIPLALALSKLDALKPLMPSQLQINVSPNPGSAFDKQDFEQVDAEVRSLIAQWDSEYLIHQVTTQFATHGFFGLSALGSTPDANGNISNIIPHRVADPFLWLLYCNGLIKAYK